MTDNSNANNLIEQGKTAAEAEQHDEAIRLLTQVIEQDAGHVAAYVARAESYLETDQFELATADIDKALELAPDDIPALCLRARMLLIEHKQTELHIILDRVKEREPNHPEVMRLQVQVAADQNDHQTAYELANQLVDSSHASPEDYYRRGIAAYYTARYNEATADFEYLLQINRRVAGALHWLQQIYARNSKYKQELSDIHQRIIALPPQNGVEYLMRGISYFYQEDFQSALNDIDEGIRRNPKETPGYYWRSHTHKRLGLYENALADMNHISEQVPDKLRYHLDRAAIYGEMDQFKQVQSEQQTILELEAADCVEVLLEFAAIYGQMGRLYQSGECINEAIQIAPENARLYVARATHAAQSELFQQAVEDLTKAIALEPDDCKIWQRRAGTHQRMGSYKNALADYNEALELDPDNTEIIRDRAVCYRHAKQYDEAIVDFERILELEPDDPSLLAWLGDIYLLKKQHDEAISYFKRSLELKPEQANCHGYLAGIYDELGNLDAALDHINQAIALEPERQGYYTTRTQIRSRWRWQKVRSRVGSLFGQ